jgi:hypothetical protein
LAKPNESQRPNDLGFEIPSRNQQTPEALGAYQKAEIERWWPIISWALGRRECYDAVQHHKLNGLGQRGRLWVADRGNHRIEIKLLSLGVAGKAGNADGEFSQPTMSSSAPTAPSTWPTDTMHRA